MICAVCGREGRGYCWVSDRNGPRDSDGRRFFKRFCSRECQLLHSKRAKVGGGIVIDPTHNESEAMKLTLKPLGEYVASIGIQRPLADYTREEILQLVDVVLTAYFENLRDLTPDDVPF